jgi:hypothetical protein
MSAIPPNIRPHVEAAKRLLRELERHADAAAGTLSRGTGEEFLAVVQERDALLEELSRACAAIAHERVLSAAQPYGERSDAAAVFGELAEAVNAAEASHQQLVAKARDERDRLAAALRKAVEPDAVAPQYGATSPAPRRRTLSITG